VEERYASPAVEHMLVGEQGRDRACVCRHEEFANSVGWYGRYRRSARATSGSSTGQP
jgi:hypothetical protein